MSEHFHVFGDAVRRRFIDMSKGELYEVDAVDLWSSYLAAFPEGTDPVFRTRTEHDCSCCKNFVRNVGNVVGLLSDGSYFTVWGDGDMNELPEPYLSVAARLDTLVRQLPIKGVFRTKMPSYGAEHSRELLDGGEVRTWNHFSAKIDGKHLASNPEEVAGRLNTSAQVNERSLRELSLTAVDTVMELIASGSLYKGEEYRRALNEFATLKRRYDALPTAAARAAFAWQSASGHGSGFRNTVIGSLIVDLSEGVELEAAVRMFESKVAPQNYMRPKALVTQRMIDEAMAKIGELNLGSAVERRHAKLSDVSVSDVIWVDGAARPALKGGLAELLSSSAVKRQSDAHDKAPAREISIEDFTSEIAPKMSSLSVVLDGRHQRNFVSLTAPCDADSPQLFRWPGSLGWSYVGDVTDSIRERVKRAGGNVDAPLRVSLSWFNYDDLDLHCECPDGHVYFGSPAGRQFDRWNAPPSKRILDVDMNAGSGQTREAVDNLSWNDPKDGHYVVTVHQYARRERVDVGFDLQFFHDGVTESYSYENEVSNVVPCVEFRVVGGRVQVLSTNPSLRGGSKPTEFWGVKTHEPVPVNALMLSPNHASGDGSGARHWFFALRGCLNPDPVRGVYNEFLRPQLLEHKRVFELIGAKTKAPFSPDQISGVGFTKGRDDKVTVDVRGDGVGGLFEIVF